MKAPSGVATEIAFQLCKRVQSIRGEDVMKKSGTRFLGVNTAFLCGVAAFYLPAQLPAQAQQPPLVIEGGTLIDGNGGAPVQDAVVVIEGNKITRVLRKEQGTYPANAQVIKADGKFVLPGLWDAQVV
jgi:hypothetical protein